MHYSHFISSNCCTSFVSQISTFWAFLVRLHVTLYQQFTSARKMKLKILAFSFLNCLNSYSIGVRKMYGSGSVMAMAVSRESSLIQRSVSLKEILIWSFRLSPNAYLLQWFFASIKAVKSKWKRAVQWLYLIGYTPCSQISTLLPSQYRVLCRDLSMQVIKSSIKIYGHLQVA